MDQNVCVYIYRMSVFLGIGAAQLSQQRNGGARGAPRVAKIIPKLGALSLALPHQKSNFRINHEKHMYLVGG
jgi:hypothetical protein